MSEEMLSSIRQKFKQLIADIYMTFQGTRGAKHGVQPWKKHHHIAKEFMRKIHKKVLYTSKQVRLKNQKDDTMIARIWSHRSSTGVDGSHTVGMVLRGEPNLRIKFHTMASPKINRRACLGKPRSIHS